MSLVLPEYSVPVTNCLGDCWSRASVLLAVNAIRTQQRGDPIHSGSDTTDDDGSWRYGWTPSSWKAGGSRETRE